MHGCPCFRGSSFNVSITSRIFVAFCFHATQVDASGSPKTDLSRLSFRLNLRGHNWDVLMSPESDLVVLFYQTQFGLSTSHKVALLCLLQGNNLSCRWLLRVALLSCFRKQPKCRGPLKVALLSCFKKHSGISFLFQETQPQLSMTPENGIFTFFF